jgi:hypothetical protein
MGKLLQVGIEGQILQRELPVIATTGAKQLVEILPIGGWVKMRHAPLLNRLLTE